MPTSDLNSATRKYRMEDKDGDLMFSTIVMYVRFGYVVIVACCVLHSRNVAGVNKVQLGHPYCFAVALHVWCPHCCI